MSRIQIEGGLAQNWKINLQTKELENTAAKADHHTIFRRQWLDRLKDLLIDEEKKIQIECQLLTTG